MKLVRVLDLLKADIAGLKADVRCRNAVGELIYGSLAGEEKLRTLRQVERHTKQNGVWDYMAKPPVYSKKPFVWFTLRWTPEPFGNAYDCGYSGRREDCEDLNDWHILIREETNK